MNKRQRKKYFLKITNNYMQSICEKYNMGDLSREELGVALAEIQHLFMDLLPLVK